MIATWCGLGYNPNRLDTRTRGAFLFLTHLAQSYLLWAKRPLLRVSRKASLVCLVNHDSA
jgi:hypothetical protein